MAKARLYAIVADAKLRNEPKGQAARVLEELRSNPEPRLATDIDLAIVTSATPHRTRQDSLRVTLYYLLIFKKQGIVAASEQPIEAPAESPTDVVCTEEADAERFEAEATAEFDEAAIEDFNESVDEVDEEVEA